MFIASFRMKESQKIIVRYHHSKPQLSQLKKDHEILNKLYAKMHVGSVTDCLKYRHKSVISSIHIWHILTFMSHSLITSINYNLYIVLLNKLLSLSECHQTVEITEVMEQEIIFPIHMPCSAHAYCDWNIRNNQIMKVLYL
jgi:hypothetical protein